MKTINGIIIVFIIILFCNCNNESEKTESEKTESTDPIELKSDFSAAEFKNAIIGKWKSVFENPEYENVIYLEFDNQNNSKIILRKDDVEKEYSGKYVVTFIREPAKENITLAKIIISSSKNEIVLSPVTFGLHNGVNDARDPFGYLLRINEPPYGVLDRVQ